MIFVSIVLACLLIGGGTGAIIIGAGMIVLERGWSMVISGSVIATGGVILLGIAMLLRELRRLPERIADALPEAVPYFPPEPVSDAHFEPQLAAQPTPSFEVETPVSVSVSASPSPSPFRNEPSIAARPRFDAPQPRIPDRVKSDVPGEPSPILTGLELAAKIPAAPIIPTVGATAPDFLVRHDITPLETPVFPTSPQTPTPVVEERAETEERLTEVSLEDEAAPSALRIQVSLQHSQSRADAPHPALPPIPVIHTDRIERESGSFWSRLGKSGKAAKTPPSPPPGPTAAERARERLSMADVPFDETAEEQISDLTPSDTSNDTWASPIESPIAPITPDDDIEAKGTAPKTEAEAGGTKESPSKASWIETQSEDIEPQKSEAVATQNVAPSINPNPESDEAPSAIASETKPGSPVDSEQSQIVGSYRAGKNVYVMYEDGTIEAETPQGVFRFDSLDALKRYIASGEDPTMAGERIERAPSKMENE